MSDSVRFVCPYTRQSTRQEDSTAISVLTTNGEIYNDNTYFILNGGKKSYERFVRIDRVEGVERVEIKR